MIMSLDKNRTVNLHLHIPIWVKELLFEAAEREGTPLSTLAACLLKEAAKGRMGLPPAPEPVCPIPSLPDVLRAYVEGSDRLIGPCGNSWPCEYRQECSDWIGDLEFCYHCGVRVF
jgi:hypothetical protein